MEYYYYKNHHQRWGRPSSNDEFTACYSYSSPPNPISSSLMRSVSQKIFTTSTKSPLPRTFSQKSSIGSSNNSLKLLQAPLSRSSSQKSPPKSQRSPPLSSLRKRSSISSSSRYSKPSSLSRSASAKCSDFARKCSSLARERRARFYIMKRCINMLVCWHNKHADF